VRSIETDHCPAYSAPMQVAAVLDELAALC